MNQATRVLADGRYELVAVLGEGGMAVVYRAFDTRLQVERAIKVLAPAVARQAHLRARFETEARTMAALSHPNITLVHDIGLEGELIYMVMELLEGGSLWDWVQCHGPMPPRLALEALTPVLPAVAAAHKAGVVHRDIKPHNIMLTDAGEPRLTDFGIAHVQNPLASRHLTRTGSVIGTWGYMAPEQRHSAKTVDERSDVYALGATLYAICTGEVPVDLFASDEADEVLAGLPAPIVELIRGATAYRSDDRYQSPEAMGEAMTAALPELPPVPEGTPSLGELPPGLRLGAAVDSGFSVPWSRSQLDAEFARTPAIGGETRSDTFDIPAMTGDAMTHGLPSGATTGPGGTRLDENGDEEPLVAPEGAGDRLVPRTRWRFIIEVVGIGVILAALSIIVPALLWPEPKVVEEVPAPPGGDGLDPDPAEPEADPEPVLPEPDLAGLEPDLAPEPKNRTVESVSDPRPPTPDRVLDSPPPEPVPEPATISVTGAKEAYLMNAQGERVPLGAVPPGVYSVMARFEGMAAAHEAKRIELAPGAHVELACDDVFDRCE